MRAMAEEISFKLIAIPPEDLSADEFKEYISMAAPHAFFEEPSIINEENLENPAFRRHVTSEICGRYSNFAVSYLIILN